MITLNDNNTAYNVDKANLNCELLSSGLYHNYYKPQAIWKHTKPVGLTLVLGFQDQTLAHQLQIQVYQIYNESAQIKNDD
jgi:hypothetical protein